MLSIAKMAANQNNAMKSTGPRSSRGIARSSRNALQHGLSATSSVVIEAIEDPAEYDCLRVAVIIDLDACGPVETLLAERVAQQFWRLRRVTRFETEYLSQWQQDLMPSISCLNEEVERHAKRDETVAALGHLFLPKSTEIDRETVGAILQAVIDFLPESQRHIFTGTPDDIVSWIDRIVKEQNIHTVGVLIELLRGAGERIANPNLMAAVYESCLGIARIWNRDDSMSSDSARRQRTEALLLQVGRANIVDRYEPRLRRDLSRTLNDLRDLQEYRAKRCTH